MIIAIHADDIKVAGEASVVIAFRAHLTQEFGELKFESKGFRQLRCSLFTVG